MAMAQADIIFHEYFEYLMDFKYLSETDVVFCYLHQA